MGTTFLNHYLPIKATTHYALKSVRCRVDRNVTIETQNLEIITKSIKVSVTLKSIKYVCKALYLHFPDSVTFWKVEFVAESRCKPEIVDV